MGLAASQRTRRLSSPTNWRSSAGSETRFWRRYSSRRLYSLEKADRDDILLTASERTFSWGMNSRIEISVKSWPHKFRLYILALKVCQNSISNKVKNCVVNLLLKSDDDKTRDAFAFDRIVAAVNWTIDRMALGFLIELKQ